MGLYNKRCINSNVFLRPVQQIKSQLILSTSTAIYSQSIENRNKSWIDFLYIHIIKISLELFRSKQ